MTKPKPDAVEQPPLFDALPAACPPDEAATSALSRPRRPLTAVQRTILQVLALPKSRRGPVPEVDDHLTRGVLATAYHALWADGCLTTMTRTGRDGQGSYRWDAWVITPRGLQRLQETERQA